MKDIKRLFNELKPNEFKSDCVLFLDSYQMDETKYLRKIYTRKSFFENFSQKSQSKNNNKFIKSKYAPRFVTIDTDIKLDDFKRRYGISDELFGSCAIYRNCKEFAFVENYSPLSNIGNHPIEGEHGYRGENLVFATNKFYLKLYKCGQASISSLYNENKLVALFDFGSTHKRNPAIVSLMYELNKTTDTVYIIISHFDTDHINLYKKIDFRKKNFVFIIHECVLEHETACYKALNEMLTKNRCKIIKLTENEKFYNNLFEVQPSKVVAGSTLTEENQTSLFVKLAINGKLIYLPGDAMYENFCYSMMPTHLLLPHHGAYINHPIRTSNIKAFVYAGHNKRYKHPRYEHLEYYKNDISRFDENDGGMIFDANGEVKDDICKILYKNSKIWPL